MSRGRGHDPRRTCVGCRAVRERSALIVVRRDSAGSLTVEPRQGSGRGAYLCPRLECFLRAWERKALVRALGCDLGRADRAAVEGQFEAEVRRRAKSGDAGERDARRGSGGVGDA